MPRATMSEGLAQGPYVAARVGFEPAHSQYHLPNGCYMLIGWGLEYEFKCFLKWLCIFSIILVFVCL